MPKKHAAATARTQTPSRSRPVPASSRKGSITPLSKSATASTSRVHWTPRSTHLLVIPPNFSGAEQDPLVREAKLKKFSFRPALSPEYKPPAPPKQKKKRESVRVEAGASELMNRAREMRMEAEAMEKRGKQNKKDQEGLPLSLGLTLSSKSEGLAWNDAIRQVLIQWGVREKEKGVSKADFRLLLRGSFFPNAGSIDCDHLFEQMDQDGGGHLDAKELKHALEDVQDAAEAWRDIPDPDIITAKALLKRAEKAEEAAKATAQAEQVEREVEELKDSYEKRADIQLGLLLFKRGIKPAIFAKQYGETRGEHQGELSKPQFRAAVEKLGLKIQSVDEIDAVFEASDSDGGGFLDADEAKAMIQQLRRVAEDVDHRIMQKTFEARRVRAAARRAASSSNVPVVEDATVSTMQAARQQEKRRRKDRRPKKSTAGGDRTEEQSQVALNERDAAIDEAAVAEAEAEAAAKAVAEAAAAAEAQRAAVLEALASASKYDEYDGQDADELEMDDDGDDPIVMILADNAVATRMADMLRRMQQLEVTQAFNSWVDSYKEVIRCLELVRSAAMMLRIPEMLHVWKTWLKVARASKLAKERELALAHVSTSRMGKMLVAIQSRRSLQRTFSRWSAKSIRTLAKKQSGDTETSNNRVAQTHEEWKIPMDWLFGGKAHRSPSPTGAA